MWGKVNVLYSDIKMLETIITEDSFFSFYLDFLSKTFMIHSRTTEEGRGYLFNSSLTLSYPLQVLWH